MKKEKIKEVYEQPLIEFIKFSLEDSIAASGDFGPDSMCGEEMW